MKEIVAYEMVFDKMRGNTLTTKNQQAKINYVIEAKTGVYLHKT